MLQKNSTRNFRLWVGQALLTLFLSLVFCAAAVAQSGKGTKSDLTGRYDGTAKNAAGETMQVTLELTEKEGAMSGMIRSDHGDFTITSGTHHGEEVTLQFDVGGPTGVINLKMAEDKLTGTWSAGDDGGPVEVKKAAAQAGGDKGKS